VSSGERTRKSPNLARVKPAGVAGSGSWDLAEAVADASTSKKPAYYANAVENAARDGDSPVADGRLAGVGDPKYPGTRETLGESGGTTLQG
jgi:hypothetical protein